MQLASPAQIHVSRQCRVNSARPPRSFAPFLDIPPSHAILRPRPRRALNLALRSALSPSLRRSTALLALSYPTLPTSSMPPATLSKPSSHVPPSARPFRRAFPNRRLSFHDSLTLPRAFPRLPLPPSSSPPRPLPHWKTSANMVSEAFPDFPRRLVRSIGFPVSHRVIHSLWITLWVTC